MSTSAPVRVRLRYPDLDTFVERFSPNVTRGGVFIASRAPRPVGDTFAFEVQLATGVVALAGEGKVIWVKEYDPTQPAKAHGMGVQFTNLSPFSREVLQRMLKIKGTQSGPNAPRGFTQPIAPLQGRANGAAVARVDTNVDLAAEFGLDESILRRALDRAWVGGARPSEDELQGLLGGEKSDPTGPVGVGLALTELRRMLDPNARRRSGSFRTLESMAAVEKTPPPVDPTPENGVSKHPRED